jgi:O-antigen/teichoic acid export membrane protein
MVAIVRRGLSRRRSLNLQALALALGSGAAQVLVAVLYIFTARSMQPAQYGLVATAIALGLAGAGFVDLGASSYWIRELASGRETQEQLNPKMVTRLLAAAILALFVIAVAASTEPRFIATGVLVFSTTAVITMLVPLRAARRAELVGLLTVLDRGIAVAVFFGQLALGVEPGLALWISIAVGDLCLALYVGISERSQLRFGSMEISNPWAGAKWYSLSTLSATAQQLDLPLVGLCGGAGAAGIYGGVNRWIQPMVLAISSFASAAAPFLATQGKLRGLQKQFLRASWILGASVVFSVGVIFAAPWLVIVLLGDSFASSAAVLRWLAGGMILNTATQPLIVVLQSRRYDHAAAIIMLVSVGVHLLVVATLAPTLGALSAGIGFFTSQALQLIGTVSFIAAIVWRRRHRSDGAKDVA